jgi:hypothetical protein
MITIGLCRDCAHWKASPSVLNSLQGYSRDLPPESWWLEAVCERIHYGTTITASGGWEGATVDSVETDANFGCRFYTPATA